METELLTSLTSLVTLSFIVFIASHIMIPTVIAGTEKTKKGVRQLLDPG